MNYALLLDTPSIEESARRLARVRQDRAREARKAFHRAMRERCGLPALEVFG